jgi:hypothetical protein
MDVNVCLADVSKQLTTYVGVVDRMSLFKAQHILPGLRIAWRVRNLVTVFCCPVVYPLKAPTLSDLVLLCYITESGLIPAHGLNSNIAYTHDCLAKIFDAVYCYYLLVLDVHLLFLARMNTYIYAFLRGALRQTPQSDPGRTVYIEVDSEERDNMSEMLRYFGHCAPAILTRQ